MEELIQIPETNWIVVKIGGSILFDNKQILRIPMIVANLQKKYPEHRFVFVFSAFAGNTTELEQIFDLHRQTNQLFAWNTRMNEFTAKFDELFLEIFKQEEVSSDARDRFNFAWNDRKAEFRGTFSDFLEYDEETKDKVFAEAKDKVLAQGEDFSLFFINMLLSLYGIQADKIEARKVIKTDETFGNASVILDETEKAIQAMVNSESLKNRETFLTQGFIGSTSGKGVTSTLGREGSDYTASIWARFLNAKKVCLCKITPGILVDEEIQPLMSRDAILKMCDNDETFKAIHRNSITILDGTDIEMEIIDIEGNVGTTIVKEISF